MGKLSDKYVAGFFDADGGLELLWRPLDRADSDPTKRRLYLSIAFSQKLTNDEVLFRIHEVMGGTISHCHRKGNHSTRLRLSGKKAVAFLMRLRKHLVVKRHYVDACIGFTGQMLPWKDAQSRLKAERKRRAVPLPKHPSRAWMAGYLDGDGSIQVRLPRGDGSAQAVLQVATANYDSEGIEIMHKAFGGSVCPYRDRGEISRWIMTMPPSKVIELWDFCGKRMVVKRDQFEFLYRCAREMGHFRDGRSIKAALKHLKAHPHRLNEPAPNLNALFASVENISVDQRYTERNARQGWVKRQSNAA